MHRITILNIPFDRTGELEALGLIVRAANNAHNKTIFIATPNPEMVLSARKNQKFKEILNNTDLNIPDGIGILWAADYLKKTANNKSKVIKVLKGLIGMLKIMIRPSSFTVLPERVTGTDMMELICKNIADSRKIYLLGGTPGIANKTASILKKKWHTNIVGTNSGSADESAEDEIVKDINRSRADILFVAFGAPKQELWIARNLEKFQSVKVVIGIGGAFDFISGNIKRAPSIMRKLGIEWLYRLILQPSRIKRIINATIVFPLTIIKSSF